ncbi:myxococcus cysteine-rich repeat containing protein [Myxococcus sp. K15C18031901]|uniref:myxococcus cysteine-rich repeat containing protein n=1 Tax=Myxococcus dinghuensis TaxID=2906761 RepID=UPI0020A7C054|nr:myxococcus cysteine-rich repeat containing protein [Myxococcus dinghuensis]MCP3102463.1 myxococcus cysteine-rich repeat containing protein [Myxococcus dinghuensis]
MKDRQDRLMSRTLGLTLLVGLLGGCGVPPDEEPGDVDTREVEDAVEALAVDPYADAVAPSTSATVLSPRLAVGPPDGRAATVVSIRGSALVLDLGEPGSGDLKVYYRGLVAAIATQVDFVKADGDVVATSTLRLLDVSVGNHTATVPYPGNDLPYRYVRLRAAVVGVYGVDAVESLGFNACGDGQVRGDEVCDDGNLASGDGCSSVCQVEPGYECSGQPSVCTPAPR